MAPVFQRVCDGNASWYTITHHDDLSVRVHESPCTPSPTAAVEQGSAKHVTFVRPCEFLKQV